MGENMTWVFDEPTETSDNIWEIEEEERPKSSFAAGYYTNEPQPIKNFEEIRKDLASLKSGLYAGTTLGASKLYEKIMPGVEEAEGVNRESKEYKFGELAGSFLPVERLYGFFGKSLGSLAEKSPILKNQLQSLANITGASLTGATISGAEELSEGKMPSAEKMLEHGAEWAALDAILQGLGVAGRFAAGLANKAKGTGKPNWEVLNDTLNQLKEEGIDFSVPDRVATRALSILEKTETKAAQEFDLMSRKIEPRNVSILNEGALEKAEQYKPKDFEAEKIYEDLSRTEAEDLMDQIAPRAESEQTLGKNIQEDIQNQFSEAEKTYEPLYQEVESKIQDVTHNPKSTINLANNIVKEINSLKTRPEGYQKVINTLNDALSDLGYHVIEMKGGKIILQSPKGFEVKPLEIFEDVPLSRTMELARRLNKIIDYDLIGPSIKDKLKPVVKSAKNEIKSTLETIDKDLSSKFSQAELNYGKTAEKFGRDSVIKARAEEATEKIADYIKNPSSLENLRNVTSPLQYKQIQRELLEHLNNLEYARGKSFLREIQNHLDDETSYLAKEILNEKRPMSPLAKSKKIKKGVVDELSTSILDGSRPNKILELWKTSEGQKLIKDTLSTSPNKNEILKYIQKQSFYDFAKSFVGPDGSIDFKILRELMKDKSTIENIRLIGGPEAVKFFQNLENISNKLNKNAERFEIVKATGEKIKKGSKYGEELIKKGERKFHPLRTKFQEFSESFGPAAKTALGVLMGIKIGTINAIAAYSGLLKLASRKAPRNAILKAANAPKNSVDVFKSSIENFATEIDKED